MTTNEKLKEAEKALDVLKNENAALQASMRIYDRLPAVVFIYEMPVAGDRRSLRLCYANEPMLGLTGFSAELISSSVGDVLRCLITASDKPILADAFDYLCVNGSNDDYCSSFRLSPGQGIEVRIHWRCTVMDRHRDGSPKRFLFCGILPNAQVHDLWQAKQYAVERSRLVNKDKIKSLSRRETEVLTLITQGLTTQQIGKKLGMQKRGVDSCRLFLYEKLNIHNLALLAIFGHENGFDLIIIDVVNVKMKKKHQK